MTDQDTLELRRMVAEDPLPAGPPDVDTFVAAGARRLRRRRIGAGAVAVAAVAAVGVPTYLFSGGPGTATDPNEPAAATPPPAATTNAFGLECGPLMCSDPEPTAIETAQVTGTPLVSSTLTGGGAEIIYATRELGYDLDARNGRSDEKSMIDVLKIGHRRDGEIESGVWALQPGNDGPVRFWSATGRIQEGPSDATSFIVLGYVDGTPEEITWSSPDGTSGAVDSTSTEVIDGYTVFYLTLAAPESYEPPAPEPTERRGDKRHEIGEDGVTIEGSTSGDTAVDDPDGDGGIWPPELTIHTSDGWSCSLADCGAVG